MTCKQFVLALGVGFLMVAAVAAPRSARADTIGPNNCSACDGNSYTLTYYQTAAQAGTTSYTISLAIDAAGFTFGPAYLMSVSPNISGWSNAVLTSAPGGLTDWSTAQSGGLNASGCDGSGKPFFCNSATSEGAFNASDSSTPLDFTWTINDSSLPLGVDGVALKVQFENSNGNKVGSLLSDDLTLTLGTPSPVPEPASWMLLATGILLALGWALRPRASQFGQEYPS